VVKIDNHNHCFSGIYFGPQPICSYLPANRLECILVQIMATRCRSSHLSEQRPGLTICLDNYLTTRSWIAFLASVLTRIESARIGICQMDGNRDLFVGALADWVRTDRHRWKRLWNERCELFDCYFLLLLFLFVLISPYLFVALVFKWRTWCKAVPARFHYSDLPKLHQSLYYKQIIWRCQCRRKMVTSIFFR
jgi:hypothetical protein